MTSADESDSDTLELLTRFTSAFNNRDVKQMDKCLHFPHIMLAGSEETIWEHPNSLSGDYFDWLEQETGWSHSEYQSKNLVLSHDSQRHYLLEYTRNRSDGSVISRHRNLWVLTKLDGTWGIKIRCY